MFEGYSLEEITDMIRHTLKDPERRDELLDLLDKLELLPDVLPEDERENWPEEDQEDS